MFEKLKSCLLAFIFTILSIQIGWAQPAPDFTVTDYNGQEHKLYEDYLDQGKTVLIKVFFVNCPPCVAISPSVQELYEEWGEGNNDVQFIEMSNKSFDNNARVQNYSENLGLTFPGVGEDGGALTALQPYLSGFYGPFFGTPTFVVIAPDGTVNYDVSGSGITNTIAALDLAIEATGAQKPGNNTQLPSSYSVQVRDAFGNAVNDVEFFLASQGANNDIPVDLMSNVFQITELENEYPGVVNPVLKARKNDALRLNISVTDIIVVVRHILLLETLDNPDLILAADANGDGTVNVVDLLTIQRVILGLIDEWPGSDSYILQPSELPISILPGQIQNIEFKAIKVGDLNGN